MRHLVISDLRHSLRIWAGSLFVLAVAQICSMVVLGLLMVGVENMWMLDADPASLPRVVDADGTEIPPEAVAFTPGGIVSATSVSFVILAVVASLTVRNVINSIVYQRRRVMALWQLAGMTDRQLLGILRVQVALLSGAAILIAAPVAVLLTPSVLDLLRATDLLFAPPMTTRYVFGGYAIGAALGVLICVLAVRGASKELKSLSPLEAIRSEGVREIPMTRRRWISVGVWGVVGIAAAVAALSAKTLSGASDASLLAALMGVVVVNVGGPVLIGGLVNGWTRLVPEHVSASWFLARKTLLAATARLVSTVGSVSTAVFLFVAMFSQQTAGGGEAQAADFVLIAGFPLAISIAGSIVAVFMAGQQREREIHLAELAGATPAQQTRQAVFEAVIVVVTGAAIGLALSVVMLGLTIPTRLAVTGDGSLHVAGEYFAGIAATLLLLNIVATVAPTLIAQAARDRIAVPE
ncbi:FtsX-like permease family protein [Microbacterium hydrocarbonoxydans]|uniref:FtsX-like permease family protein n=1 Tax=Microbacterium hydrocarbonoxydans TaxID=273678 RepID=UPI00203EED4F|nr:FtsX-like permease family protein [Microbacterium hydrocarbonoxydans]MCM3778201.1 hypothetical protein [Microbacterium hydrocarbonoxydans]